MSSRLATVTSSGFRTFSREEENTAKAPTSIDLEVADVELAGHQHYMHKEMLEQPASVEAHARKRVLAVHASRARTMR